MHNSLANIALLLLSTSLKAVSKSTPKQQDGLVRFVKNSGICETTPGVQQISGYIDIGTDMSMVREIFD